ncbi:MAG: hypothetical protein RLZ37_1352, partial [Actinomycetota bacterium]
MIRKRLATILSLGLLFAGATSAVTSTQVSAFASPTKFRYIVTFHDGVDAAAMASNMAGSGLYVSRVYGTLFSGVAVDMSPEQANALAADPNVALVESDARFVGAQTQDGADWSLARIDQRTNEPNAHYSYPASAGMGVVVYLVDSGLVTDPVGLSQLPHQDIAGRAKTGYSFVYEGDGTEDCLGHGTHVAGTVAGTEYGVAKMATVIPARVIDCSGAGSASEVIAALDWIAANRDRSRPAVVNMSIIGPAHQTLDNVVNRLFNSGVTVIAAAGNDGANACAYSPARAEGAITVGSTNSSEYREQFSNFGSCVDIFAPGTFIKSAWIGGP